MRQNRLTTYYNNFKETEQVDSLIVAGVNADGFDSVFKGTDFADEDESLKMSVIISTFNKPVPLRRAIESVLTQKDADSIEIIIGDNSEPSQEILEWVNSLAEYGHPIRYYRHAENIGMAGNWNRLFQLARCNNVLMLHDDDYLLPGAIRIIQRLVSHLPNFSAIQTNKTYGREDKNYEGINEITFEKTKLWAFTDINIYGPPSGMLFNRIAVKEIGGFSMDEYPSLDFWMYVKLRLKAPSFFINLQLTHYDLEDSITLKYETRRGFITSDYWLQTEIFRLYRVPKFAYTPYLSYRNRLEIDRLKKDYGEAKVDITHSELGLNPELSIVDRVFCKLIRESHKRLKHKKFKFSML